LKKSEKDPRGLGKRRSLEEEIRRTVSSGGHERSGEEVRRKSAVEVIRGSERRSREKSKRRVRRKSRSGCNRKGQESRLVEEVKRKFRSGGN
jgi:hypothetical protein